MDDNTCIGARPTDQALVSDQAASRLAPPGFDPSRCLSEGVREARGVVIDWSERMAVSDLEIEAALHAYVPGGARVWAWLPQKDGWTPHQTAHDVMRAAIATVDAYRAVTAGRNSDQSGEAGKTEGLDPQGASAGRDSGIAPTPSSESHS